MSNRDEAARGVAGKRRGSNASMTENDLKALESLAANAPAGPCSAWHGSDTIELLTQSGDPIAVRCPTVPDTMPTIRTFAFLASPCTGF
jgi:hypothetical protein